MNIGIIVYSQTGNTYTVAQMLKEELSAAGQAADIERVTITGATTPATTDFQFNTIPAVDRYDLLVFGAPTQGFTLAPVMTAYLRRLTSLQGKKIACFVTKQLRFSWTGGKQAVAKMKRICEAKGGTVCGLEIVVWSEPQRAQSISSCLTNLRRRILDLIPKKTAGSSSEI